MAGALCAVTLGSVPAACTFYTGCPDAPAANNANGNQGGAAAGGTSASGGGKQAGGAGGDGSTNGPQPWGEAAGSLEGRTANCGIVYVSSNPAEDELLVGIDQFGLWANTDDATWVALGSSTKSAVITNIPSSVVYDPDDPQTFWEAGIYGPGAYKTTDGGQTFTLLGDKERFDSLSIDFNDPNRQTLIAGPHERNQIIFKSSDGGMNWEELTNLPDGNGYSNSVLVIDAQTYLVGCGNVILRTTDGGASWTTASQLGGFQAPLVGSDGTIYWNTANNQGLLKSVDAGESWERIVGGGVIDSSRTPLELPDGRLAALQGKHVIVSADQGFSWQVVGGEAPIVIKGLTYSSFRKAFYASTDSCDHPIPGSGLMKLAFDYETE